MKVDKMPVLADPDLVVVVVKFPGVVANPVVVIMSAVVDIPVVVAVVVVWVEVGPTKNKQVVALKNQ